MLTLVHLATTQAQALDDGIHDAIRRVWMDRGADREPTVQQWAEYDAEAKSFNATTSIFRPGFVNGSIADPADTLQERLAQRLLGSAEGNCLHPCAVADETAFHMAAPDDACIGQLHAAQALGIAFTRQHLYQCISLPAHHTIEHLIAQRAGGSCQQHARPGHGSRPRALRAPQNI